MLTATLVLIIAVILVFAARIHVGDRSAEYRPERMKEITVPQLE